MSTQDDLTSEEFEELNAAGPYNSGVWRGRGVTVTQEESLAGRIENLGSLIRRTLLENFSLAEMTSMSIADVGCYDGSLIEHLADLPFRHSVGFEPRKRNIEKGKSVRRILRIPSKVEYRQASLDGLGDEKFDVVICTGLLHHVESLGDASRKLAQVCSRLIFIETQCLSENHEKAFLPAVEPKDIIYFNDEVRRIGLIGCKFESDFYDGSAVRPSIVGVPSPAAVEMYLEQAGFGDIEMVMSPSSPWKGEAVARQAKAACFVARRDENKRVPQERVSTSYEEGLAKTCLAAPTIDYLYQRYCMGRVLPVLGHVEACITTIFARRKQGGRRLGSVLPPSFRDDSNGRSSRICDTLHEIRSRSKWLRVFSDRGNIQKPSISAPPSRPASMPIGGLDIGPSYSWRSRPGPWALPPAPRAMSVWQIVPTRLQNR